MSSLPIYQSSYALSIPSSFLMQWHARRERGGRATATNGRRVNCLSHNNYQDQGVRRGLIPLLNDSDYWLELAELDFQISKYKNTTTQLEIIILHQFISHYRAPQGRLSPTPIQSINTTRSPTFLHLRPTLWPLVSAVSGTTLNLHGPWRDSSVDGSEWYWIDLHRILVSSSSSPTEHEQKTTEKKVIGNANSFNIPHTVWLCSRLRWQRTRWSKEENESVHFS